MSDEVACYTHMTYDEAFELLDRIARGISLVVGPVCEALVQSISAQECRVLSIYNGQVSGRQVGSTLSIYGRDTSEDTGDLPFENLVGIDCDEARTADGRRVKSSTWLVRGEGYVLALGVNLDVTELGRAADILAALSAVGGELSESLRRQGEAPDDPASLIDECLAQLGKPAEALGKQERVELVRLLSERGFFGFQRSAPVLAERLGVSRSTIYNYLNSLGASR